MALIAEDLLQSVHLCDYRFRVRHIHRSILQGYHFQAAALLHSGMIGQEFSDSVVIFVHYTMNILVSYLI